MEFLGRTTFLFSKNIKIIFLQPVALAHLVHILAKLEQAEAIELFEKGDEEFFICAMDFAFQTKNIAIAERLLSLYRAPNNHVRLPAFLGEAE